MKTKVSYSTTREFEVELDSDNKRVKVVISDYDGPNFYWTPTRGFPEMVGLSVADHDRVCEMAAKVYYGLIPDDPEPEPEPLPEPESEPEPEPTEEPPPERDTVVDNTSPIAEGEEEAPPTQNNL